MAATDRSIPAQEPPARDDPDGGDDRRQAHPRNLRQRGIFGNRTQGKTKGGAGQHQVQRQHKDQGKYQYEDLVRLDQDQRVEAENAGAGDFLGIKLRMVAEDQHDHVADDQRHAETGEDHRQRVGLLPDASEH